MPLRKARAWFDWLSWKRVGRWAAAGAILVTVAIQLAIVSPKSGRPTRTGPSLTPTGPSPTPTGPSPTPTGPGSTQGNATSSDLAPAFSERGVVNGQPLTSARLQGKNVLLFFGRSVACRACLEQMRSLQRVQGELRLRGVMLVNVTTDPAGTLRQAAQRYRIATPTISDDSRAMSGAYGALGHGTHAAAGGHTFVMLDRAGRIRWRHDYPMALVPPRRLLAATSAIR